MFGFAAAALMLNAAEYGAVSGLEFGKKKRSFSHAKLDCREYGRIQWCRIDNRSDHVIRNDGVMWIDLGFDEDESLAAVTLSAVADQETYRDIEKRMQTVSVSGGGVTDFGIKKRGDLDNVIVSKTVINNKLAGAMSRSAIIHRDNKKRGL
jgi:hypothetical protein